MWNKCCKCIGILQNVSWLKKKNLYDAELTSAQLVGES